MAPFLASAVPGEKPAAGRAEDAGESPVLKRLPSRSSAGSFLGAAEAIGVDPAGGVGVVLDIAFDAATIGLVDRQDALRADTASTLELDILLVGVEACDIALDAPVDEAAFKT